MIVFGSFDEYIDITKQAQQEKMRNINCYLFPKEIDLLIKKRCLFYVQNDTTLQIIAKRGRYFKVYFYGKEDFSFIKFDAQNLPIITDISYSQNLKERDLKFREKLLSGGFVVNSSSSRMQSKNMDFNIQNEAFYVEKMNSEDVQAVMDIWNENFDAVKSLLYSKEEMLENKEAIYVLKNHFGDVVGAMEIILSSSTGIVQHIAVKKTLQGRGLGSVLESFYINQCKTLGIGTLLLYTIDDDLNAQKFHKKFGFDFDGKHNIQFRYGG